MSYSSYRVGDYCLQFHDGWSDKFYSKVNCSLKYFDNLFIDVEISMISDIKENNKTCLRVKSSELFDIVYNKNYDGFWPNFDSKTKNPHLWFINYLQERKIKIVIYPKLECRYDYYLNSKIFDENIKITTKKKLYKINNNDELEWLESKGFVYG